MLKLPTIVRQHPYVAAVALTAAAVAAYATRAKIAAFAIPFFQGIRALCSAHPVVATVLGVGAAVYALYRYMPTSAPASRSQA